jgi:histidyl-tRNA synthetase
MYLFKDPGGREVGLKYDLTVPLARVMAQYPELPRPFKRYAIQPAFRAENTQRGRYREFYQCDFDTVGTTSPIADAEILAVISQALTALRLPNFTLRLNSRQILNQIIEKAGLSSEKAPIILQSIDKLDKKPAEEVREELSAKGLNSSQISDIFQEIKSAKPNQNLEEIISLAEKLGAKNISFDPTLVRGLDYYTGAIFETVVTEPHVGSVTGGGRYNNLIKTLGGPDLPATGSTIGLDRICDVVRELNLWPDLAPSSTQVLITIFSSESTDLSLILARSLREASVNTELYPEEAKLDKQLKYADKKGIPFAAIIGPDEAKNNTVTLKNLQSGTQEILNQEELISKLTK